MKFQKAQTIINIENVDGDVNVKGLFNLPKQLVTIPFIDVNEVFGRTQNLVEVYKLLRKTSKVVLVNGIGGIGKTTIAKALLETYKKKFKHIIWVQVESDIKTDFVNNQELVFILDLVEEFNKLPFSAKKEEGFKLIISRLRTIDGPNLMIIDNVYEDIENIKTLDAISLKPNWKVLVTSREQLLGFDNYLLGELSNIDALDLFFYHYKVEGRNENNEKLLATVFNEIEYNTLLIELLAKTGQSRRLFIDEIAEIIKKKALIFLESIEIDSFIQFQRADNQRIKKVFTFLVGIFEISSLSNYEKVILSYFSVMSNKPLPFFAKDNREGLNTFFQSIDFSKRVRLSKAINNLSKKGWLIWDGKNDSFRMHQTIQEIIRYKIKPSVTDLSTLIKFLSDVLAESHLFKKIFAKSHSEIVYKNILIISPNDQTQILWANFVNNLGMINKEIGEYDKAEQFYNDTIIIKENLVSSNSFFKLH